MAADLSPVPGGGVRPGEATLRWEATARSVAEIGRALLRLEAEPGRIAGAAASTAAGSIAARTSVMNLAVVAGSPEIADHAAAAIGSLTGRHPSRTLIIRAADPDGPARLEARISAWCMLPRAGAAEACAELVHVTAGGETGRHLTAIVEPLLVHDLPVTVWWPGEPPFGTAPVDELLADTDRLVVDGAGWSRDGLARIRQLAALQRRRPALGIRDFALVRQARWREAIATVFDLPEFRPYLWALRRIAVAYATSDPTGAPGTTNLVKPLYHVAWLASRLGLEVAEPLAPVAARGPAPRPAPGERPGLHRGLAARLRGRPGEVAVVVRPVAAAQPAGATVRIELLAERRGSELRADVTAEAENVHVRAWLDGVEALERTFKAPRRTEVDLLGEALEGDGHDRLSREALAAAARLAGADPVAAWEPGRDPWPDPARPPEEEIP